MQKRLTRLVFNRTLHYIRNLKITFIHTHTHTHKLRCSHTHTNIHTHTNKHKQLKRVRMHQIQREVKSAMKRVREKKSIAANSFVNINLITFALMIVFTLFGHI